VGQTARLIGEELGLADDLAEMLGNAAPPHDIGKLAIPHSILLKPGSLTDAERAVMRAHVRDSSESLLGSRSPVLLVRRGRWSAALGRHRVHRRTGGRCDPPLGARHRAGRQLRGDDL
jgi:hypothetical protein